MPTAGNPTVQVRMDREFREACQAKAARLGGGDLPIIIRALLKAWLYRTGTVSEGCPNTWHDTAPARANQTCPECPSVKNVEPEGRPFEPGDEPIVFPTEAPPEILSKLDATEEPSTPELSEPVHETGIRAANIVDGGEAIEYTGKRQGITFATWGRFNDDRGWLHIGWSSAETPEKACSAARSTNPYLVELGATSVTVPGAVPIRFTKLNNQIGNKPRKLFR